MPSRSPLPTCKTPRIAALAASMAPSLLALLLVSGDALAFKCLPIYGNWCGPGHPGTVALPPVDPFDAACMRHDLCTASGPETPCDRAFVAEIRSLAAQIGYLPRPLQWAEYAIRVKAGGPWGDMPMPSPWDAMGLMSSALAPCP